MVAPKPFAASTSCSLGSRTRGEVLFVLVPRLMTSRKRNVSSHLLSFTNTSTSFLHVSRLRVTSDCVTCFERMVCSFIGTCAKMTSSFSRGIARGRGARARAGRVQDVVQDELGHARAGPKAWRRTAS